MNGLYESGAPKQRRLRRFVGASVLTLSALAVLALHAYRQHRAASGSLDRAFVALAGGDLDTAERVVFGHDEDAALSISQAVQATTALPGFYKPARIKGVDYIDGGAEDDAETCSPIIKFSNPAGVSPQAVDGVITLTARVECADDVAVWAWTDTGDDVTMALDVYDHDGGGAVEVIVPVDEGDIIEGCGSSSVTAALVDDMGDVIDLDRTHVKYAIAN